MGQIMKKVLKLSILLFFMFNISNSFAEEKAIEYKLYKVSDYVWYMTLNLEHMAKLYKKVYPNRYNTSGIPSSEEATPVFLKILAKAINEIEENTNKKVASFSFSGEKNSLASKGPRKGSTPTTSFFINLLDK